MARRISILLVAVLVVVACYAKFQEGGQSSLVGSKDLVLIGGALVLFVLLNVIGRRLRGKDGR